MATSSKAGADHPGAEPYLPSSRSLDALAAAVPSCRGCDLWRDATQAVFGQGPPSAGLVLVGEQPGDVEDREGEPFVGPAGRLLDRALADSGLAREEVYLTNAVKHFRFTQRAKRRIHEGPAPFEGWAVATTHPSAVLRSRDRDTDYAALVADLEVAAGELARSS